MRKNKLAVSAALAVVAVGIAAGTVHADPVAAAPDAVTYQAGVADGTLTVRIHNGSFLADDNKLEIENADGVVVSGTPLTVAVDQLSFPIAVAIDGDTATLTPEIDQDHATLHDIDLPFQQQAPWQTPYDREVSAWNRLASTVGVAAVAGGTFGTIVGALFGCVAAAGVAGIPAGAIGTLVGPVGTTAASLVTGLPACIVGATTTGALGALVGAVLVTAPILVAAAIQYFTTIDAPFTPAPKP
ncbi:hypothetical protein [Nocardia stercoris]|uniref:DUF8020 domain-containing protein n=1 Tax=Nocardia stercoris TaxID=2483361 RepID=A0A3M2L9C7_9NOCA|nr:hypothetical protein [Nocardia stercoris]RMI31168.1 hypothetical protein EBN03_17420 [Nocardia stercoris]